MSGTSHIWRPSSARVVSIGGFVPVPRGVSVPVPAVLAWPAKDPADVLDYQFDVSAALVGNASDAIASVAAVVTPAGGLAVDSTAVDGAVAVLWLSGGVAGTVYTVQIDVTTVSGRTVSRSVLLPVVALNVQAQATSALTTGDGQVVSDESGNPILLGS